MFLVLSMTRTLARSGNQGYSKVIQMPFYSFKCPRCRVVVVEQRRMAECSRPGVCQECQAETFRVPDVPFFDVDKPITLEHVEANPRTFENKRELKRYCDQKGLVSGALL